MAIKINKTIVVVVALSIVMCVTSTAHAKMGFWTKAAIIGGAGIACLVTGGMAAPVIAAAAGSAGLLGAAGTGTAIVTLHGCALTSASLAAVGGTVAGGTAVIAGTGAAAGSAAAYSAFKDK